MLQASASASESGHGSSGQSGRGFGDRLSEVVAQRGRLCVGIDPHPQLLDAWGLPHTAAGLERFAGTCVEAFGDIVATIKPQVAFFEAFGAAGFAVLERTLSDIKAAGALSIADAKRGDIGSTMQAYSRAWLGDDSPLAADAVTVTPYLGFGALESTFALARATGRGVFVLAATSNPEGASVQQALAPQSQPAVSLSQYMVDQAAALNAKEIHAGASAGSIGVVVGATLKQAPQLDNLAGPVLMPGVGAQGGTAADVDRIAGAASKLALPNISRAVLGAGPNPQTLRQAALDAAESFRI